jgi:hypothetical protein
MLTNNRLSIARLLAAKMKSINSSSNNGSSFSTPRSKDDEIVDGDDHLEKMLLEAEVLAAKMRTSSAHFSVTNGLDLSMESFIEEEEETPSHETPETDLTMRTTNNNGIAHSSFEEETTSRANSNVSKGTSTSQQHNIDAAIFATKQMELALQALNTSTSLNVDMVDSPDSNSNSPAASSQQESPVNADPLSDTWERVTFTKETDDDYVPIADYSAKKTMKQRGSVQWEKVAFADATDDDYVPIADYSSSSPLKQQQANNNNKNAGAVSTDKQSSLRKQRKMRLRRTLVRITALLQVLAVAYGLYSLFGRWPLQENASSRNVHVPVAVEDVETSVPAVATDTATSFPPLQLEQVLNELREQRARARPIPKETQESKLDSIEPQQQQVEPDPMVRVTTPVQVISVVVSDTPPTTTTQQIQVEQIRPDICKFAFASLFSPVCKFSDRAMDAKSRRENLEGLVDSMFM